MEETAYGFGVRARDYSEFSGTDQVGTPYEVALVYLDDIIVIGKSFEEHLNCLNLVLG